MQQQRSFALLRDGITQGTDAIFWARLFGRSPGVERGAWYRLMCGRKERESLRDLSTKFRHDSETHIFLVRTLQCAIHTLIRTFPIWAHLTGSS